MSNLAPLGRDPMDTTGDPSSYDATDAAPVNGAPLAADASSLEQTVEAHLADPDVRAAFVALANEGRLDARGSDGKSALEHLASMVSTPRNAGLARSSLDGATIAGEVIAHLADPTRTFMGKYKGTCGAAAMEWMLLRDSPGEFTKLVDDLTSAAGAAKLRSGAKITLPADSIPSDASERDDVDRMMQSAFMNRANFMGLNYDNPGDRGDFLSLISGDSGMTTRGFRDLYENLTGKKYWAMPCFAGGESGVADSVAAAASTGDRPAVNMKFGQFFATHWLSVESVESDASGKPATIVLRNPWGDYDDGQGDPPRRALGGGLIEMKWSDFVANLRGAVYSKALPGAIREARPVGVHATYNTLTGAGVGATYNFSPHFSLDASGGKGGGSVGATAYLGSGNVVPTLSANVIHSTSAIGSTGEHNAVDGRVGVDYVSDGGFQAGAYVGAALALGAPTSAWAPEAGVSVGFRF